MLCVCSFDRIVRQQVFFQAETFLKGERQALALHVGAFVISWR